MPRATGTGSHISRYEEAWESINRLIRQGGSWSGYERNCFFFGAGADGFANYSAASGLDDIGDGRAVALIDPDGDGDPDLLIKSRTGPQLRFLENVAPPDRARIALRLAGRAPRRQVIGARVEVRAGGRRQVKELRAGTGFLSQDAPVLWFGLGDAPSVDELRIRWPSGTVATFAGVAAGRAYVATEGGELTSRPLAEARARVEPAPPVVPPDEPTRAWLASPLTLPPMDLRDVDGRPLAFQAAHPTPSVLSVWIPDCPVCVREITEWGDGLSLGPASFDLTLVTPWVEATEARVREIGAKSSVPVAFALEEDIRALALVLEDAVRWSRDLAVPTTLLLDVEGRAVRVYQGAVSWAELSEDAARLRAGVDLAELSVPFPGRFHATDATRNPFHLGIAFLESGFERHALDAFRRALEAHPDDVEALYNVGVVQLRLGDSDAAREAFLGVTRARPDFPDAQVNLGVSEARRGRRAEARRAFEAALRASPLHTEALLDLAGLALEEGQGDEAIALLERAARAEPQSVVVAKRLGAVRRALGDLPGAVREFERAIAIDAEDAETWSQLAVIRAESGDLSAALADCRRALALDPRSAAAHSNEGLLLDSLGQRDEARASYRRAIALAPDLVTPYLNLARSWWARGDDSRAIGVLEELLDRLPEEPSARALLSEIEGRRKSKE